MGNIGSQQTGNTTQTSSPAEEDTHWTESFPRSPPQYKLIVPARDAHQKLRPTGNGEILQAGGTISGRSQQWQGVSRSSSIPSARHRSLQQRSEHKHNYTRAPNPPHRKDQIKRFGSEPDLRSPSKSTHEHQDRYKARKKYKAPAPPPILMASHSKEFDINCDLENSSPIRRARLFKTRAETKKKISSPINNRTVVKNVSDHALLDQQKNKINDALIHSQSKSKNVSNSSFVYSSKNNNKVQSVFNRQSIPLLQRTKSSPEFQAELMEVTRKLISSKKGQLTQSNENEKKLKTLDYNLNKKERIKNTLKDINVREMLILDETRSPTYGKESTPEQSPPKVKTFYFGMEHEDTQNASNSIDSVSSESDAEQSRHDISLQLRPILPKKQLEIPRFSPATAWKLLSSIDTNPTLNASVSEEGFVCIEEKIENLSRPPPPHRLQLGPRSNHDKSGDSGISGDETPEAGLPSPRHRGISWTPQQDLGDDSSLEEESNNEFPNSIKFAAKPHVFSLSLPRENHLAAYINEKSDLHAYSSLQKLKRSMSGMLGGLANKKGIEIEQDISENWFLSRSAPNSLNNGFNSLELRSQNKYDEPEVSNTFVQSNTRRIMYLPQANGIKIGEKKHMSKSYENISMESRMLPENLQDPPKAEHLKWSRKKPKKFTFQSTVRQIERRRLAEKLSKEAERKEQQRLRELEAMQRVEEEFQKKRAKEKASIRQQLRLYSLDDSAWSSLPPNLEITDEVRQEPDGAVSSTASSPIFTKTTSECKESKAPGMQILSEFRQTQREYKEFRSGSRYAFEQTTVHPRVTYNMPKATGSTSTGNYRKDFAHGIKSGESSYSEESLPIKKHVSSVNSSKR